MVNDIQLTLPEDSGYSPRTNLLRNHIIAAVTKDDDALRSDISDTIIWHIIGDRTIEGMDAFVTQSAELHNGHVKELVISDIITHGYLASVNGRVIRASESFDFCHVYWFTGVSKTAKIKEITSYIIHQ